jgi:hypothetical protein
MDGSFFSRAFLLIFCISCPSLWGIREGEDPTDDLELRIDGLRLVKGIIWDTIHRWHRCNPSLLKTRITRMIQNERNPLLNDGFKRGEWAFFRERLQNEKANFYKSIEEVDSLIHLIREIEDTSRSDGLLDIDRPLLEALQDHLNNLRAPHFARNNDNAE